METKIKRMMARKELSQADLARLTRIDSSRINRYVNGCCFPNARTLAKIAVALGCTAEELQDKAGAK